MWIRWKDGLWEDGFYKYEPKKVVELPDDIALRYVRAGRATKANPPKWAMQEKENKQKKKIPSARKKIKRQSSESIPETSSLANIADQVFED